MGNFVWPVAMALLGVVAHILKRVQKDGEGFDALAGYLHGHGISVVLTLIGCAGSLAFAYQMGELGPFMGFTCGYMANSIFAKAEKRGLKGP